MMGKLNISAIRLHFYKRFVNRNSYIKFNYEYYVNTNRTTHNSFRIISWLYLIKLNIESTVFNRKSREERPPKKLKKQESMQSISPEEIAKKLCESDVVSFDIFDTLIFRPFSMPTALFYCVGEKLQYPDFHTIRIEAESAVRRIKGEATSLKDIYDHISEMTGIDPEQGAQTELSIELDLCMCNPYMKKVWDLVQKAGKNIILASDMYLPSGFIAEMLKKCGYTGFEKIFISNECNCGKHDGSLYDYIKKELGTESISHIGDNYISDVKNAQKHGFKAIKYKNVNYYGGIYRPNGMSPIIGSAYAGIVNQWLYNGDIAYSAAYEYGFKYGGLMILGFCGYIHKIAQQKNADKILFLSRDGYIVKQVYDILYPDQKTAYVYWSRNAAAKLGADLFKDNFIKRFILQKTNHNISLHDIVQSIGIADWEFPFSLDDDLTTQNASNVEIFIRQHWEKLLDKYKDMDTAAQRYFSKILEGCKRVVTVDCGWAGSGNIMLEHIVNRKWGMNCGFTGVLAGSNSYNQYDSDFSETFLIDEKLNIYCFSSMLNRDKYIAHIPASNHNIYFEFLLSAPEPSFLEFCTDGDGYKLIFDTVAENAEYIREIHKGELDFIDQYVGIFKNYPFMRNISGSDAYTPFMDAMKYSKKYIDNIFSECVFDETTNGKKVKIK